MDIVQRAEELGILRKGWRFIDYCFEAAPLQKWMCVIIWGEKGNLKSDLLLQHGYSVFHGFDEYRLIDGIQEGVITNWNDMAAWDETLKHVIFRPDHFAKIISEALEKNERLAWLGWDDINIHLPRSMYSTDRETWETISKNWEGSRTMLSIFECTAPRKDKVVSFILSDMAWDILCSGRKVADVRRWMWDRDFYEPERVNKSSIKVEESPIIQENVPKEIWDRYWQMRLAVNSELTSGLVEAMHSIDKPKEVRPKGERALVKCPICGQMMSEFNLQVHLPKCERNSKKQARKRDTPTPDIYHIVPTEN